ncbi:MAG: hypothetical protein ACK5BN_06330, partial [Planctomycetota bacterium]
MADDAQLARLADARHTTLKDEPEATVEVLGDGVDAGVRQTYRTTGLRGLCGYADGDRDAARRLWRAMDRRSGLRNVVERALAMTVLARILQP